MYAYAYIQVMQKMESRLVLEDALVTTQRTYVEVRSQRGIFLVKGGDVVATRQACGRAGGRAGGREGGREWVEGMREGGMEERSIPVRAYVQIHVCVPLDHVRDSRIHVYVTHTHIHTYTHIHPIAGIRRCVYVSHMCVYVTYVCVYTCVRVYEAGIRRESPHRDSV